MLIDDLKQKIWKLWSSDLIDRDFINKTVELVATETLNYISLGEGWEETRDFYAEKLGLPAKYKK